MNFLRALFGIALILTFVLMVQGVERGGMNCTKDDQCNYGRCHSKECECEEYYTGEYCNRSFGEELGGAFIAYVVIMGIPFVLIILFQTFYLIALLYLKRWVTNVANIVFLCIYVAFWARVIFLIDPFGGFKTTHTIFWTVFYYLTFNAGFSGLTLLLVFWIDILKRQQKKGGKISSAIVESKRLRWSLIIVNSSLWMFFVISIIILCVGSVQDLGETDDAIFRAWRYFLAFCCLALSAGFGFYGWQIYHSFKKTFVVKSNNVQQMIKKVTAFTVGSFITLLITVIYLIIGIIIGVQEKPESFLAYMFIARIIELTLGILPLIVISKGNPIKRFLAIFTSGISLSGQTSREGLSKTDPGSGSIQPEASHISDSDLDVEKVDWGDKDKAEQS